MADREGGAGSDDLFDDLDSFFTPADEPEAPAPSRGGDAGGEDWGRLRDSIAGPGEDGADDVVPAPSGPDPGFLEDEDSDLDFGDDLPELSLDDLRKAPPEYRDLPVAPAASSDGPDLDDLFDEPDPLGPPPVRPSSRPSIEEVEAVADSMAASGIRDPDDLEDEPVRPGAVRRAGPSGEPESLTGPAWEEPAARTLTREPEPPRVMGRNLPVAIVTGVALAVVALIALAVEPWAFAIVAGGVALLGQAELYTTMRHRGFQAATALGLVLGALVMGGAYFRGEPAVLLFVALSVPLALLWHMAAAPKARVDLVMNVGATLFGILYVPLLASYVLLLLIQQNSGQVLMLAVLGLTIWYDIAAFAIGTLWGSRPLAPTISPKKSWEGLIGATVATFAVAIAVLPFVEILTPARSLAVAAVVVVFAPLGDLAESAVKRDLGVKDMGSILPGHGGMLDRFDSVLFVAPAAFYLLRLILQ
jgi:phosphatidate cytidylyltransferase